MSAAQTPAEERAREAILRSEVLTMRTQSAEIGYRVETVRRIDGVEFRAVLDRSTDDVNNYAGVAARTPKGWVNIIEVSGEALADLPLPGESAVPTQATAFLGRLLRQAVITVQEA